MEKNGSTVRILHLEDSEWDAELIQKRLEVKGLHCEVVHVRERADFEQALEVEKFDVMLCDYNIPNYDGLAALRKAREKHPTLPVLIISGCMGEDEAVKCLQQGATDYLLKDRLERLAPAIKRALHDKHENQKKLEAAAALADSEERFRQLAEQSSDGFWFVGLNPERVLYVSPAVERIWGVPAKEFYEQPRRGLIGIHEEDRGRVEASWERCLRDKPSKFEAEYRVVRPDGTIRYVSSSGTGICNQNGEMIRVGGIAKDITEKKQDEKQALRAQRLESIGTLAGGVAHDLNNALAPILMVTELLRMDYPERKELIEIVAASAKRGADMVKQLLTFAKGAEGERLLVQPQHLFKEIEKIIGSTFPKNIRVRTKYAQKLNAVLGDVTQLHQVLLNLCVNARDAMPAGGTLTLEAENVDLDSTYAHTVPDANEGSYVVWKVIDTGTGIPPEIIEKIFDPFFTTKGPEKGTGLGLSTLVGIVRSHGGFVQVYSAVGQGSTFSIYLPAVQSEHSAVSLLEQNSMEFHGSGELIMVVDDEPAVREVLFRVLKGLRFEVVTASDGTEAIIHTAEKRKDLKLVITDMHMPYIDGLTLVRTIQRMVPEVPIIASTGRLEEREMTELQALGVAAMLEKPFTKENLVEVLKPIFAIK